MRRVHRGALRSWAGRGERVGSFLCTRSYRAQGEESGAGRERERGRQRFLSRCVSYAPVRFVAASWREQWPRQKPLLARSQHAARGSSRDTGKGGQKTKVGRKDLADSTNARPMRRIPRSVTLVSPSAFPQSRVILQVSCARSIQHTYVCIQILPVLYKTHTAPSLNVRYSERTTRLRVHCRCNRTASMPSTV